MNLLRMSLSASLLIALVAAARFFWRRRIPGSVMNVLWGIVCCKLMIPADLFSPVREWLSSLLSKICLPQAVADIIVGDGMVPGNTAAFFNPPVGFYTMSGGERTGIAALPFLYMAGGICLTVYFGWTYIRCMDIARMSLPAENIPGRARYESCFPVRRVRIRVSDRIVSPLTCGILRPVILLPETADGEKGKDLIYVLEHEMAHIRRFDSVRKILLAIVMVCHWFNPAVWGMYLLANRDIELACDEMVLRIAGSGRRAAYANILLDWEAARPKQHLLAPHFMGNFLEERIKNIMNKRKITVTGVILSVMLLSGTAVVYAMTPSENGAGNDGAALSDTAYETDAYQLTLSITDDTKQEMTLSTMRTETGGNDGKDPSGETGAAAEGYQYVSYVEDPTLGGIFQLYTPEEYAKEVEFVKKYADGDDGTHSGCRAMEEALEKLKADNGKGEYVIYKAAFEKEWEEDGYSVCSAFNPAIVMAPELEYKNASIPLTAERYEKDIESVTGVLDEAVADGQLTPENRDIILGKMYDNLEKLKQ